MNKAPKRVGIVSYNMYGNFTNYGSALQTFALQRAIDYLFDGDLEAVVVDYCPDILADKDILNPFQNMWDKDTAARERCRLSLPAIKINYEKFVRFYNSQYRLTSRKYTSDNFNDSLTNESLNGYICGSDTVFAVPEFGFDDGYYANYPVMQHRSVAYAASFGDYDIPVQDKPILQNRLNNFKAIALRENDKIELVRSIYRGPLCKVIDPTLLLKADDYESIVLEPNDPEPYILVYSRRGNDSMFRFAEKMAHLHGMKLIEISLNAQNAEKHTMRYDAGVEEFLGLVKNAAMVVTNSFHGMIFAVQFRRPFYIFSRELCGTKISELLNLFGISDRLYVTGEEPEPSPIDYDTVHHRIEIEREKSLKFLKEELDLLLV